MMPSVSDFKSHVGYSEFPPQALDMLGGECHSNKLWNVKENVFDCLNRNHRQVFL